MIRLPKTAKADLTQIKKILKSELEQLPSGTLSLDLGTTQGGMIDDTDISVTIMNVDVRAQEIHARVGVFFTEIVGGCSCGDDPVGENAYCEFSLLIDVATGIARQLH